jgi:hypothetical protein
MREERVDKLRRLLAMEIRRVTEDLERRQPLLVQVWGRQRVRAPFLDTTFSRWTSLGFQELTDLSGEELEALDAFYRELDEVRLYLAHTEDMPRSLDLALTSSTARLRRLAGITLERLGAPPLDEVLPLEWAIQRPPPPGEEVEMTLALAWGAEE